VIESTAPVAAAAPAAVDPRAYLREGVDAFACVEVALTNGRAVLVMPAMATAAALLAGTASPYAIAALRLRDAYVRQAKGGPAADAMEIAGLAISALRTSYDAAEDILVDWLAGPTDVLAVATAALGATATPASRARGRAQALIAAGMGDAPLTAMESASLADWAANAGRAPAWR